MNGRSQGQTAHAVRNAEHMAAGAIVVGVIKIYISPYLLMIDVLINLRCHYALNGCQN